MDEIYGFVDDIHTTLDTNKSKCITTDIISSINTNVSNICDSYDGKIGELIHNMKVLESKHQNEWNDSIKQFETQFQKEKDMRNKIDRIWRGKILMRQIANDRFYRIAKDNETVLNSITKQELEEKLVELKIPTNRLNSIDEHIGAKMAYAIICGKLIIPNVPSKFCLKYINDNNDMHPQCKPLSKVMSELRTFESTVKTLTKEELCKYNVEPNIVTEEIQFFVNTE